MAFRLTEIFLSVLLLSLLCNTLKVKGGSLADDAADLVPVWEPALSPTSEVPWRPSEPAIFGTFRNCGNCKCCTSVGPRICRSMYCCKEIVCGNEGCTRPTVIYCGCDTKTCVSSPPPKEWN